MHGYRVIFRNNQPVSATKLDHIDTTNVVHITKQNDHRYMDWLVVCGNNEDDALSSASNIFKTFWAGYVK